MIRMIEGRTNMSIAEPLRPACPMGYVRNNVVRGGADLWIACAVSPVLTDIYFAFALQRLSDLSMHSQSQPCQCLPLSRFFAPMLPSFCLDTAGNFCYCIEGSRCSFSLPFPIPFGLLLIKLTLRINIQLLVNFINLQFTK